MEADKKKMARSARRCVTMALLAAACEMAAVDAFMPAISVSPGLPVIVHSLPHPLLNSCHRDIPKERPRLVLRIWDVSICAQHDIGDVSICQQYDASDCTRGTSRGTMRSSQCFLIYFVVCRQQRAVCGNGCPLPTSSPARPRLVTAQHAHAK